MNIKVILGIIIFVIVISLQFTLNRILLELREIKEIVGRKH